MAANFDDIVSQALELPLQDRARLVLRLTSTLDEVRDDPAEVERLWNAEIERRVEELEKGLVETVDGEEVMAELRMRLKG